MIDLFFTVGYVFEYAVAAAAIPAVLYFIFSVFSELRKHPKNEHRILLNIGGIVLCLFILSQFIVFRTNVRFDPYDGTRIVLVQRAFFVFHRSMDLYLRRDPQIGNQVWMAKDNGTFYPFFHEIHY